MPGSCAEATGATKKTKAKGSPPCMEAMCTKPTGKYGRTRERIRHSPESLATLTFASRCYFVRQTREGRESWVSRASIHPKGLQEQRGKLSSLSHPEESFSVASCHKTSRTPASSSRIRSANPSSVGTLILSPGQLYRPEKIERASKSIQVSCEILVLEAPLARMRRC